METIVGVKGKDFVMLAADSSHPHSIMVLKDGKYRKNSRFSNQQHSMIRQKSLTKYVVQFQMKTKSTKYPTRC